MTISFVWAINHQVWPRAGDNSGEAFHRWKPIFSRANLINSSNFCSSKIEKEIIVDRSSKSQILFEKR